MKAKVKTAIDEKDDSLSVGFVLGPNPAVAISLDDNDYLPPTDRHQMLPEENDGE